MRADTPAPLVAEIAAALRAGDQDLAREARHKLQGEFGLTLLFANELANGKGVSNE